MVALAFRAVTAHVRCGIGSWGALGGRCLRMADYVRRLAATRAPPPQRANVGFYEAAARVNCVPLINVVPFSRGSVILLFALCRGRAAARRRMRGVERRGAIYAAALGHRPKQHCALTPLEPARDRPGDSTGNRL